MTDTSLHLSGVRALLLLKEVDVLLTQKRLRWLKDLILEDKLVKFYQWCEWRKLRQKALERDNFECQQCKAKGKYKAAQNVHHLKEVKDYPELAMALDNLECVCIQCHNKIHDKRLRIDKRKPFFCEEKW